MALPRLMRALAGAAAMLAAIAAAPAAAEPRLSLVEEGPLVARHGAVFIAGQPDGADFDAWAAAGVTTVVNLRSRAEIARRAEDPAGAAAARGLAYRAIPMGRNDGYDPAQRAALTALLAAADGPVVLYCRSGRRAAHLYAAHLVVQGELDRDAVSALGWPSRLDGARLDALIGRASPADRADSLE